MFNIDFYETSDGYSDIQEFLESLRAKANSVKNARIQYGQVARYIELLQENGTNLPTQIAKHLEDEIWELRPGDNRVLFFYFDHGTYVLLHHFRKKTQKTPPREISRAKLEMKDYIARKEPNQ
ncbi:MAG: type II toxin-antitoxin system RelE/ParE family toxin [Clostridia bacterium]|nr:type II toxin-antitoxin system RelE/ParE family toxin [Clostridia bacterium]